MGIKDAVNRLTETVGSSSHAYVASVHSFADLSVETTSRNLRLEERAIERGKKNEPSSQDQPLDPVELEIVDFIRKEQKGSYSALVDQIEIYNQRISALDLESRFSIVTSASEEAVAEFRVEADRGLDRLHEKRRSLLEVEQERDAFRSTNRLKRTAEHPVGYSKALKWAFIFAIFAIEVIVNANFLSESNVLGLVGGGLDAFLFAVLNVFGTFLIAKYLVAHINHRKLLRKFVGLVGIATFICFSVSLNLTIAHYRELSAQITENVGNLVVRQIVETPLGLHDIKSWALFGLGLFVSLAILVDVLLLDDRYPGFGKVERKLNAARNAYISWKEHLVDQLQAIKNLAVEGLESASRDLSKRRSEYEHIVENRKRMLTRYQMHLEHLERAANQLLSIYRTANKANRTEKAPDYFRTWNFSFNLPKIQEEFSDLKTIQNLNESIAAAQKELKDRVTIIHDSYVTAVRAYHKLDDLVGETGRDGTSIFKDSKSA